MNDYHELMAIDLRRFEAYARKELQTNPDDPKAKWNLAGFLMRRGELPDAERLLEDVVSTYANDHDFWGLYGQLKYYMGKYEEAYDALNRALVMAPQRFTGISGAEHVVEDKMFEGLRKAFVETQMGSSAPWLDGKQALAEANDLAAEPWRRACQERNNR